MTVRVRAIAAFSTLLAFSAFFAESVWASTCPPETPIAAEAHLQDCAEMTGSGAGEHAPADTQGDRHTPGSPCPIAAGPGSCVSVIALAAPVPGAPAPEAVQTLCATRGLHDRLAASTIFRPPRA